jgi:hypothetical protein
MIRGVVATAIFAAAMALSAIACDETGIFLGPALLHLSGGRGTFIRPPPPVRAAINQ